MGICCGGAASCGGAGASTLGGAFLPARVTSETRERPAFCARSAIGDDLEEREESVRLGAMTAVAPTADMADIVVGVCSTFYCSEGARLPLCGTGWWRRRRRRRDPML